MFSAGKRKFEKFASVFFALSLFALVRIYSNVLYVVVCANFGTFPFVKVRK